MMSLCWSVLLLCLSVSAENIAKSGGSVTLECSSAGCPRSIEGYTAMYLYKDFKERDEVLYYYSTEKVTPRPRYKDRIQTNGSLRTHTITISNLTEDDTGLYHCVYNKIKSDEVRCNVYTLLVIGHQVSYPRPAVRLVPIRTDPTESCVVCKPEEPLPPLPSSGVVCKPEEPLPPLPSGTHLVLIIMATITITTLLTVAFIVLILPRVKHWTSSRRSVSQVTNDNVYEVMTKNVPSPLAAPEHSPPSLYDLAF